MADFDLTKISSISEGKIIATINGKNVPLIEAKSVEAKVEFNKEDVRVLGNRWVGSKITSITGSGTFNVHYVDTRWAKVVQEYQDKGTLPKMTFTATMQDEVAANGKQTVQLQNVLLDGTTLFALEADDGTTENEMDFTFAGVKVIDSFKDIAR